MTDRGRTNGRLVLFVRLAENRSFIYDGRMSSWDVVVVGGGPAGLMAACRAAERGRRTLLLEKRPQPGAKILLSGGTRWNLTHATDRRGIVEAFGAQGRFLHSALAALGPEAVVDLFEAEGVATKVEAGGKVFPRADRAGDVLAALLARLGRTKCTLALDEPVAEIRRQAEGFQIVTAADAAGPGGRVGHRRPVLSGQRLLGRRIPLGCRLGHTIVAPRPALVPITTHAPEVLALQGITLADVRVSVLEPAADPAGRRAWPSSVARSCSPISASPGRRCSMSAGRSAATRDPSPCCCAAICCRR